VTRSARERARDVRRLLVAAASVYRERVAIAEELGRTTGLSAEGVELGFGCLERDATDAELDSLVEAAGDAERVHVVLSANVFVASLRALALARAASARVTVRPSPRDPVLTRALVQAAGDDALRIVDERDVGALDCTEIHAYGSGETVAAIRARARAGVAVRAHGAGLGVALVTSGADLDQAADAVASDVVVFDQRGCMSPRVVLVVGEPARAEALAVALDARLSSWGARVPRGTVSGGERAEATRWQETLRFAGRVWAARDHAVGLGSAGEPLLVPPAGRHLYVAASPSLAEAGARLGPLAPFIVVVGCDEPAAARAVAPPGARISALGRMQRPPLDGPVDRRDPSPSS
jgi:acyl-CoA reductase-like NAD-dependent aldehyde dehydrogenase